MIKLYSRLHNANNNFRKQFLWISLLLFLTLHTGTNANAQCPVINVTPATSCGGFIGGPCDLLTASGNADTYVWSPLAGLFTDCAHTIPYTGTNTTIVYAAPTAYTVYTVTGTIIASGCSSTATARVNYTPPPPVVTPNPAVMCLGDPPVKLKVASLGNTVQFCSGSINIPVPDNNPAGASNSIAVSGIPNGCIATAISVTINMPHTWIGDMVFVLRGPNGQIINLDYRLTATGGNGPTTGFVNSIISSNGTAALNTGVNPYTGTFRADAQVTPAGGFGAAGPTGMQPTTAAWSNLFSLLNGSWTLGFYDGGSGDLGTLTSWCLGITYSCGIQSTPATWSPITGLFFDPAATIPYTGIPVDSVWVRPVQAGTYTYVVTTQSLPGPLVGFTNPTPIVIPVGGPATPYSSDIIVSGLPSTGVRVRSVVLNGMNHTWSKDIDVVLQSPAIQNVILMSDLGGANAINNATYTFMDSGPGMNTTAANPTGTYKPTNVGVPDSWPTPGPSLSEPYPAISMFTGNMNGTWKLFVNDQDGTGGQGVITGGYTINFDTVAPCTSPPRMVVVTVGGLPISITAQPVNKTICTDGVATFSVTATGGGTLNYQWQVSSNGGNNYTNIANGGVYSGATTTILTITSPPLNMSGYYYRVLINGTAACAATTSAAAMLTVKPLPVIVITASPLIIGPGETTTIFSTVTPNPAATYTWYYNGSVLPGATADTLLVDINGLGDYQLQVTDVNGCTDLSNNITIVHSFAIILFAYPNPSGGIFQVRYYSEANTALQRSLTIYSNRGERIMTRTFTQTIPYQQIDIDIRANGKGFYWIELRDAGGNRLAMNGVVVQ